MNVEVCVVRDLERTGDHPRIVAVATLALRTRTVDVAIVSKQPLGIHARHALLELTVVARDPDEIKDPLSDGPTRAFVLAQILAEIAEERLRDEELFGSLDVRSLPRSKRYYRA